jgi:putative addiction module component (TIGR02574 family)
LVARVCAIVDGVSAEAERLLAALLLLPRHEQVQLMTVLADSVEGDDETDEVDVAWIEEAKRRLAGIRAGERIPVPWEAVEARLLSE